MTSELQTRRNALRRILGTLGAAAALGEAEIGDLLAQVQKIPDLSKVARIRTTDNTIKALKILLAPKGQEARVFRSEFGRRPALAPTRDAKTGKLSCKAYLAIGASCAELGCDIVTCNGLGEDILLGAGFTPKGGTVSEAGVYNKQMGCTQNCTKCDKIVVPATAGARINPVWLRSVQADPYIKGLMAEYGVDTAEGLENQLSQALSERRAGR